MHFSGLRISCILSCQSSIRLQVSSPPPGFPQRCRRPFLFAAAAAAAQRAATAGCCTTAALLPVLRLLGRQVLFQHRLGALHAPHVVIQATSCRGREGRACVVRVGHQMGTTM